MATGALDIKSVMTAPGGHGERGKDSSKVPHQILKGYQRTEGKVFDSYAERRISLS